MLEFFIDNIFDLFGGRVFQQTAGIPMGTSFSSSVKSPLALVLYCYFNMPTIKKTYLIFSPTCSFIRMRRTSYRGFSIKNENKLARSFNVMFRYIDPVFSLNNSRCSDFVDRIYPVSDLGQIRPCAI